jgi:demethylmenaquinone methyltransferase/2-methoxy-6-polyprenyl-1,4-benzoquinol methylase
MATQPQSDSKGPPPEKVKQIFDDVAHGYDRANSLMTFGLVQGWRKALVRMSAVGVGGQVLDCATGTGDLALEFKRAVGETGRVVGTDFCKSMLDYAPGKADSAGLAVAFELADVTDLPYADGEFDVVSIAYGIRNVDRPQKALAEMARVCKPGGRVMILETGTNDRGLVGRMHWLFSEYGVPVLGMLATGKRKPYEYLRDSSRAFPSREAFLNLMRQSHPFQAVSFQSLLFGSSFLYKGEV